jgi:hypothetical protein
MAQRKTVVVKEKHPNRKVVVVNKRHGLFRRTAVYHPFWAPKISYGSRWVYFPRYNFYWDNYRNVYVIRTGIVWVTSTNTPKEVETVDLSKEKSVELSKSNDTKDTIQEANEEHQKVYKVE